MDRDCSPSSRTSTLKRTDRISYASADHLLWMRKDQSLIDLSAPARSKLYHHPAFDKVEQPRKARKKPPPPLRRCKIVINSVHFVKRHRTREVVMTLKEVTSTTVVNFHFSHMKLARVRVNAVEKGMAWSPTIHHLKAYEDGLRITQKTSSCRA